MKPPSWAVPRSVSGKIAAVVLFTTASSLLFAGVAMLTHDVSVYRQSWASDLKTEADILALSTAPALAFDDREAAERDLAALRARGDVLSAALYTPDGTLYAHYTKPGQAPPPTILPTTSDGLKISGERIELAERIIQHGELLGAISLRARYDLSGRIRAYLGIFVLVMLASMGLALVLSTALQRVIARPLEAIADVARKIVSQRDYSLRARKTSRDEIGVVVDAFNSMLDEVQSRTRDLELSNAALRESEHLYRAIGESMRDADRRKDEFLATLAHELRNPLAPIRYAVKLLDAPGIEPPQRQWAHEIVGRQVQRMALLLDDLLDVSRITRGRLELKKEYVELASLVTSAVETARPLIESKRHQLEILLPAQGIQLDADPLRLSQALSNLLTNAAKYTDAGGNITLAAHLEPEQLTLAVRDTGIGLSAATIPKVFEMFAQINSAVDRTEGGLGIGLALVKGLIALHGGTVEASSPGPGLGSEFIIRLPRAMVVSRPDAGSMAAPRTVEPAAHHYRVLLADDNREAADTMSLILKLLGYQVSVAHSGLEALEVASHAAPQIVILDIGMPDMTGYEVARRLRQMPWGRAALFIAITGWGQENDKEQAAAAGFDYHLTKPADPDRVAEILAAFVRAQGA